MALASKKRNIFSEDFNFFIVVSILIISLRKVLTKIIYSAMFLFVRM